MAINTANLTNLKLFLHESIYSSPMSGICGMGI